MAKFRCRACGREGTWVYDPERFTCPLCDSIDVHFEIFRGELPDDDPVAQRMDALAEAERKKSSPKGAED